MESILTWLVTALLNWLKSQLLNEAAAALAEHQKENQQETTNTENLEKYNAAKTRADEIAAALALLNRSKS